MDDIAWTITAAFLGTAVGGVLGIVGISLLEKYFVGPKF